MNLTSSYMGLKLKHPIMVGASPLVDDLGMVRRIEDAGASAIVMHSLFEEQIDRERHAPLRHMAAFEESYAEARSYLPVPPDFALGPDQYLERIRTIKEMVEIPVIGSLNGTTASGWLEYARLIEAAGADALELNVYYLATDPEESSMAVEWRLFDILRSVRAQVKIPVSVKLSPFYSSVAHVAKQLKELGADGLVLFNRFYQPDIDVEALEVVSSLRLSNSSELLLRLRWLAILSGRLDVSLAVTGGVHSGLDVIKSIMAGADAVQVVAAVLESGPEHLADLVMDLEGWLEEHDYDSVDQLKGSMNLSRCPDPGAFERSNYMRVLQVWRE